MANQLVITCPIFNVDTKFAHCEELRHRVWRGDAVPVRKGCQACMSSGKCPVAREISTFTSKRLDMSIYQSDEPKKGKLRAQVLEDIRPVLVRADMITKFGASPAEQQLIETSGPRIDAMAGAAPRKEVAPASTERKRQVKKPAPTKINQAAATGDMAAAINEAAA